MDNSLYLQRLIKKVFSCIDIYYELIEEEECELDCFIANTTKDTHLPSEVKEKYLPIKNGDKWGSYFSYAWFKADLVIDEKLQNKKIYLKCKDGSYENLVFIDGKVIGLFDHLYPSRFNTERIHKYCLITNKAKLNDKYHFDLEGYASHEFYGTQPYEKTQTFGIPGVEEVKTFHSISVVVKNEEVESFVYNLQIAKELYQDPTVNAFIKAKLENLFIQIYELVSRKPLEDDNYNEGIIKANKVMKTVLFTEEIKSKDPTVYMIGHSHMDTCWLWTEDETTKKIARTLSNAVTLLKRYKEYKFMCSSTYHLKLMEKYYPDLFADIVKLVKEGRFEPNGGTYIECDCNLIGNESLIRQFVYGQKFLKEKFNYHADTFFLPDTFGYSASLPQILNKFDMPYFLTTKLSWNDSNKFPYDAFKWQGIDNSEVLVHFNTIQQFPTAKAINKKANDTILKHTNNISLLTYGYGDGGGGPSEEMVLGAIKSKKTIGVVNCEHSTVSHFMDELAKKEDNLPMYHGELYLEGHRGTLTSMSKIKKYNRKIEVKLANYEALEALSLHDHNKEFDDVYEDLLVNHFHDILPGTCIKEAIDYALVRFNRVDKNLDKLYDQLIDNNETTIYNLNKVAYDGTAIFTSRVKKGVAYDSCHGNKQYVVNNVHADALSEAILDNEVTSAINYENNVLVTPYYKVKFNKDNEIVSLIDLKIKRELVKQKGMFNKIAIYEDVPYMWDNWDFDYDLPLKEKVITCKESKIVLNDKSTFIMQNTYELSSKSTLKIDIIFYHNSPRIDFDCDMNFDDTHRAVKALFDTSLVTDIVKNEIQFGNINRSNYLNDVINQAKFEICQQKYSTLVEPNYCFTLLNDCKYGLSCRNSTMGITLIKSGTHPDPRGDAGHHTFKYAIYPIASNFNKENVIDEAYRFNNDLLKLKGKINLKPLKFSSNGVVIETIKKSMHNEDDLIIRCYEAVGTQGSLHLEYNNIYETDFLEESAKKLNKNISFKPFEIKTICIKKFKEEI